jgi:hypothetical protein
MESPKNNPTFNSPTHTKNKLSKFYSHRDLKQEIKIQDYYQIDKSSNL